MGEVEIEGAGLRRLPRPGPQGFGGLGFRGSGFKLLLPRRRRPLLFHPPPHLLCLGVWGAEVLGVWWFGGLGFKIWGLGFRVWGAEVWWFGGVGFRV